LNVKPQTIKLLEENTKERLYISLGNNFFDIMPKVQATKENSGNQTISN
jgi:hypothetical protein